MGRAGKAAYGKGVTAYIFFGLSYSRDKYQQYISVWKHTAQYNCGLLASSNAAHKAAPRHSSCCTGVRPPETVGLWIRRQEALMVHGYRGEVAKSFKPNTLNTCVKRYALQLCLIPIASRLVVCSKNETPRFLLIVNSACSYLLRATSCCASVR